MPLLYKMEVSALLSSISVGNTGRKFAQESYAVHERILILDSTGTPIQSIKSPASYTFDHTEWITNGKQSNIVATFSNINGAHPKIVLVNPSDSSIIELAEGDELWHPTLGRTQRNQIQGFN